MNQENKMTDTIEEIRDGLSRTVENIRNDKELIREAKLTRIAKAWIEATTKLRQLNETATATRSKRITELTSRLLGLTFSEGNDPNSVISYRDAQDRADSLATQEEAIALINRAALSNDHHLAKAALGVAIENWWMDAVNAYSSHNTRLEADVDELWNLRSEGADVSAAALAARLPSQFLNPPTELQGQSDSEIQRLADPQLRSTLMQPHTAGAL